MKSTIHFLFFFLFGFGTFYGQGLEVRTKSPAALLLNAKTGKILYEKNGHQHLYPASTTKIATALFTIQKKRDLLDEVVTCPRYCLTKISKKIKIQQGYDLAPYFLEPDGTSFGLLRGERISLRTLLYGMMLASGNDAANVIAHHVAGTVSEFMEELNEFLITIGCEKTRFCNPHGLHYPYHKSTAYELALITKAALEEPLFREIVGTHSSLRPKTNKQNAREIRQANRLMRKGKFRYPQAIGVKTGYTKDAGYCIVAAAEDQDRTLIAVVLNAPDKFQRYRDAITLFDAAFAEKKIRRVLYNQDETRFIRQIRRGKSPLTAILKEDLSLEYYPSEEEEIDIGIKWKKTKLPISQDQMIGTLLIKSSDGKVVISSPLYAKEGVEKRSSYLWFLLLLVLPFLWWCKRKIFS